MSRKNRKNRKAKGVLHSLNQGGLSRLATTVRADGPTLVLGSGGRGTVKNDGLAPLNKATLPSRLSQFAQKLVPGRGARGTTKKIKQIAKQMAKGPTPMKVRRSRLPLVIAVLIALLGGAGYYAYQALPMPDINISQYLDYKKWLGEASGTLKPDGRAKSEKRVQTATSVKSGKSKATPVAKNSSKAKKSGAKNFSKLSRAEKERIWKANLAKARKKADQKYRRTSAKQRKKR